MTLTTDSDKIDFIYNWCKAHPAAFSEPKKNDLPFEVYPNDLPSTLTYLEAEKAVAALGDGWRIPTLEELKLMYKNKDKIGGFCTKAASGSDAPGWYWSSTEHRVRSSYVHVVRFSDGYEGWNLKDSLRFSCRPVRLVEASAPAPAPSEEA